MKKQGGTSGNRETDVRRVLALDEGIGSFGVALQEITRREGENHYQFPDVRSLILPGDWGELKSERDRRRLWRTRTSHLLREKWLRDVFRKAHLEDAILEGRKVEPVNLDAEAKQKAWRLVKEGDPRLEREFPKKGENTVFCGAALRCLLLLGEDAQVAAQGRKLDPWQIFKALHNAIQKRGYDPAPAWKKRGIVRKDPEATLTDGNSEEADEKKLKENKEDQESLARALAMEDEVRNLHDDVQFQHPCFWEAMRMGLWSKASPERVELRQTHHAQSTKWADQRDPADIKKESRSTNRGNSAPKEVHEALQKRLPAIFPREMVEAELLALCAAAKQLLPALMAPAEQILYGLSGVAYPNVPHHNPEKEAKRRVALHALPKSEEKKFVRGKWIEYDGVLAQKAPTFDNRGPGLCVLIPHIEGSDKNGRPVELPRYHAARFEVKWNEDGSVKGMDSLLAAEVSFLLRVKNFRFTPEKYDPAGGGKRRDWLNAVELCKLYADHFHSTVVSRMRKPNLKDAITKTDLEGWLHENILQNARAKPGQEEANDGKLIDKPRVSGRARMSRPALRLMKALLLSGLSPAEFKAKLLDAATDKEPVCPLPELGTWTDLRFAVRLIDKQGVRFTDPTHGMVEADLKFLDSIGDSWEQISVRDERLQIFSAATQQDEQQRKLAIERLIASEINPIIRHRLGVLNKLLDEFLSEDKRPDRVVLEFARDEFMGKDSERKKKLMKFQNDRRDSNLQAAMELSAGASEADVLRWQLVKEQGNVCLFCGNGIGNPNATSLAGGTVSFDDTHLAHIVADSKGGPRAYNNLIAACSACNSEQRNAWHAQWLVRSGKSWDCFVNRVKGSRLRGFKKKLLCTQNEIEAAEMIKNRAALQQTAWIAKLSQVLVCLKFGWPLDFKGQERRVVIVPGSATNQVAKKYKLYRLLGEPGRVEEMEDAIARERAELAQMYRESEPAKEIKEKRQKIRKMFDDLDAKCRDDRRHHALDAMVLSFLPHWAADTNKRELWFGLPKCVRDWKVFFGERLDRVMPMPLRIAKPTLGETIYGMRKDKNGEFKAVLRRELIEMAFAKKTLEGELQNFSAAELKKSVKSIRAGAIRGRLEDVAASLPSGKAGEQQWLDLMRKFRLKPGGPVIRKASCWADKGDIENYKDLSKHQAVDGSVKLTSGQWRRTKKEDRGKWVYWVKPRRGTKLSMLVRVVRVYESPSAVKAEVLADPNVIELVGYFQSGCVVCIRRDRDLSDDETSSKWLRAGKYEVRSLEADRRITLRNARGESYRLTLTTLTTPGDLNIVVE